MIICEALQVLAKSAVPFIGALVVGWLGVRWALSRYKDEKLWDRRLSAYADALVAVADLRRLNRAWYRDLSLNLAVPDARALKRSEDHNAAWRKVHEVFAVGMLVLPTQTQMTMEEVLSLLDRGIDVDHWREHLTAEEQVLGNAITQLRCEGRKLVD